MVGARNCACIFDIGLIFIIFLSLLTRLFDLTEGFRYPARSPRTMLDYKIKLWKKPRESHDVKGKKADSQSINPR